jgi:hypothetical protein
MYIRVTVLFITFFQHSSGFILCHCVWLYVFMLLFNFVNYVYLLLGYVFLLLCYVFFC